MFKILSLDGGGTRGTFIAACLAHIEEKLDHPISHYFDLIVATSTGSIIAVPLGMEVPAATIEKFYLKKVYEVFKPNPPYFSGVYKPITWTTSPFLELFTGVSTDELVQPKYSSEGLRKIIQSMLRDKTLVDSKKCRLNITAVDLKAGMPTVFKTPHLPGKWPDENRSVVDIILAATAAPTYFNPVTIEKGTAFCDGALWANNPGIVGYSEAMDISRICQHISARQFHHDTICMLSIGTGYTHYTHPPPQEGSGVKWWSQRVMEIMFNTQSQSTSLYLERMLPQENYHRLNFEIVNPDWGHVDSLGHIDEMAEIGHKIAAENFDKIKDIFFKSPSEEYHQYPPEA
ncbi:CBASS cGAMP-activated phospholipase [Piscirickettsia litoralis]|uniref:CBASS cGAMP-activated phospholipase n=1 Tax=Piscirickettsia litoralis TaxID=1891921 RepID=UPI0013012DC2|nr:CBASS cGAMP-activated phospholipase [Piscirickettsia litoralis]